ncbi:MAG: hypothetical protein JWQ09_1576 [Segetibacter sp.]|nr:hypothetical protein [Segetibacter sp.]
MFWTSSALHGCSDCFHPFCTTVRSDDSSAPAHIIPHPMVIGQKKCNSEESKLTRGIRTLDLKLVDVQTSLCLLYSCFQSTPVKSILSIVDILKQENFKMTDSTWGFWK